jgi:hypothetical protein
VHIQNSFDDYKCLNSDATLEEPVYKLTPQTIEEYEVNAPDLNIHTL